MKKKPPPEKPPEPKLGLLQDKIKDWKKTQQPAPPSSSPTAKKPPPPPPRAPPQKSDEELFADAVNGVDQNAVLKKYDETPPATQKKQAPVDQRKADESLFESFVGKVDKKG